MQQSQQSNRQLVDMNPSTPLSHVPPDLIATDLACLAVTGADAATFLQSQLTADVDTLAWQSQLAIGGVGVAARVNIKGRVTASLWLLGVSDGFWLLLSQPCCDALASELKKYAMFSKVTVAPQSLAISAVRDQQFEPGMVCINDSGVIAQLPLSDYYLHIGTETQAEELWQSSKRSIGGVASWRLMAMNAGFLPLLTGAEGLWLPQELRLDEIGGVSFDKGCYFGQEVVARIHFRGKVKQQLDVFTLEPEAVNSEPLPPLPEVGSWLTDDNGKKLGQLSAAAYLLTEGELQLRCAAVMRATEKTRLHLGQQCWRLI